ncbi:MAG TPA: helix-turn-helix domain-containing protein [Natronosporangium sp.]
MRRDAQANRERILAAAEQVFGQRGPAGSTEEVARLAGTGIATIFRHFPTKDALIEATLLRHFERLTEQARRLTEREDPVAALRRLLQTLIESSATKLTLAAQLTDDPASSASLVAASHRLRDALHEVLARAQATGAVRRSVQVDELFLLIRGLSQAQLTASTDPGTVTRAIDLILAGLAEPAR